MNAVSLFYVFLTFQCTSQTFLTPRFSDVLPYRGDYLAHIVVP